MEIVMLYRMGRYKPRSMMYVRIKNKVIINSLIYTIYCTVHRHYHIGLRSYEY